MDSIFVPQDTKCESCIFRDGFDCRIHRIELYKENAIEIVPTPQGNILKKFICPYYRDAAWLESKKETTDLITEIRKENGLPYLPIILYLEGRSLENALRRLLSFSIRPKEVFIIIKPSTIPLEQVKNAWSTANKVLADTGITWNVHLELEDNSWHNIFKFYNRSEFLLLINSVPFVNNKWPNFIAKKVQEDLEKFSYAENREQTMMLISPYVYKAYYFEHGANFITKLRQERHKQKCIL